MACGCNNGTSRCRCGCRNNNGSVAGTNTSCGCQNNGNVAGTNTSCGCQNSGNVAGTNTSCGCSNNGNVGGTNTNNGRRCCPSITCGVKQAACGFARGIDTIISSVLGCCRR